MALVESLPHRPFAERGQVVDGRFRWRLGLRPLDLDDWFEWGSDGAAWVAEKTEVMSRHADIAFATLPDLEPESAEVADAIARHVGRSLDTTLHPLDAAARLVPDDLVVMAERGGRLVFGGGSVCFPNRWDLRSKVGATMAETHEPVPGVNDQLGDAIDRFLGRLVPGRAFWRLGWGLIDVSDGFAPPAGDRTVEIPPDIDAGDVFVRVERETLRRFALTGAVLFTIRTYVAPVGTLSASDRRHVVQAVAAMDDDVRSYKDVLVNRAMPPRT